MMYKVAVYGVWLSLVERYVRDVEVAGSNPVTPITWRWQHTYVMLPSLFQLAGNCYGKGIRESGRWKRRGIRITLIL
mgnify:CR=1 FL=1